MVAALLALPIAFTGCSQDDPFEFDDKGKESIDTPSLVQSTMTVSQLTFEWNEVEGAVQYAYELRDPQEELVSGNVTTSTTATFTGLKDNTIYTLNVWALTALNSEKKGAPVASLKAKTDEIIQLSAPQLASGKGNGGVLISWTAIEHAASYSYVVYDDQGKKKKEGSVTESQVLLGGLAIGTYTIEVTAVSDQEAYSNSEVATLTFNRERLELWRRTGTYESASNGKFTADIVSYDDGSYAIEAPYGEAGYAINFSVDPESSEITIQNGDYADGYVSFNVSSNYWLYSYTAGGYSSFSGDRSSGEVWFFTFCYDNNNTMQGSGSGGYDAFYWEQMSAGPSIDDLVGTYAEKSSCQDFTIDFANWVANEVESEITITKIDDTTIELSDLYNGWGSLRGTVDMANGTITFAPQTWGGGYYLFCPYDNPTGSVVATFDENYTITFHRWTAYYAANGCSYIDQATTVLTKQ